MNGGKSKASGSNFRNNAGRKYKIIKRITTDMKKRNFSKNLESKLGYDNLVDSLSPVPEI